MRRPNKGTDTMTKTMTFAVALTLVLVAVMIAAAGINDNSPADAAGLPFAVTPGIETPVRATKSDRLNVRQQREKIKLSDRDSAIYLKRAS